MIREMPAGPIPENTRLKILDLLEECWDEFEGSAETAMTARKITRESGAVDLTWVPPHLSFTIDRHGGTALGSIRAEKQRWIIDIENKTASQTTIGYRQLYPAAPRLDVDAIARSVCKEVQKGPSSTSDLISTRVLVWKSKDEFQIRLSLLIPDDGPRQTITGRRKRLRVSLQDKFRTIGWELISVGRWLTFKKK
jgi:hypothetical protein